MFSGFPISMHVSVELPEYEWISAMYFVAEQINECDCAQVCMSVCACVHMSPKWWTSNSFQDVKKKTTTKLLSIKNNQTNKAALLNETWATRVGFCYQNARIIIVIRGVKGTHTPGVQINSMMILHFCLYLHFMVLYICTGDRFICLVPFVWIAC